MTAYIMRRLIYGAMVLVAVNVLLFLLFFVVNPPEIMAEQHLSEKHATPENIQRWLEEHGYDLPRFHNSDYKFPESFTQTLFWQKMMYLFVFDFGISDATQNNIADEMIERIPPSLSITIPSFLLGLAIAIAVSMIVAFYRGSPIDSTVLVICVILMSISGMIYVVLFQYFFSTILRLAPASGFARSFPDMLRFISIPIAVSVVAGLGGSIRYYRTVFLEETNKDYIRTARAKGLGEGKVLFKHALRNALLPILTNAVVQLPFLIMGSLLVERFFGIPGLGSYLIDAIARQDFAVIRAMVFLGTFLYIISLIMVDISYCIADPRIRIGGTEQ